MDFTILHCKNDKCKILNTLVQKEYLYKNLDCLISKKFYLDDRILLVSVNQLNHHMNNNQEFIKVNLSEDNIIIDIFDINKKNIFCSYQIYQIVCEKKIINSVDYTKLLSLSKNNSMLLYYVNLFKMFN